MSRYPKGVFAFFGMERERECRDAVPALSPRPASQGPGARYHQRMNDRDVNVLIAVPTMGAVHPILASRLIYWGRKYPTKVQFYFTFKVAPVDRARNQIVEFFLAQRAGPEKRPFSHLLMIDSDTIPPIDALDRLIAHELPIVTALTPILRYKDGQGWESFDNCFLDVERDGEGKVITTKIAQRGTGLQEIYRCGAACILIERSVINSLDKPYFKFITNEDNTSHVRSEDIDFCDRVRELGFVLYADTDIACEHYKDIML